jgi:hypothetical protein
MLASDLSCTPAAADNARGGSAEAAPPAHDNREPQRGATHDRPPGKSPGGIIRARLSMVGVASEAQCHGDLAARPLSRSA